MATGKCKHCCELWSTKCQTGKYNLWACIVKSFFQVDHCANCYMYDELFLVTTHTCTCTFVMYKRVQIRMKGLLFQRKKQRTSRVGLKPTQPRWLASDIPTYYVQLYCTCPIVGDAFTHYTLSVLYWLRLLPFRWVCMSRMCLIFHFSYAIEEVKTCPAHHLVVNIILVAHKIFWYGINTFYKMWGLFS